MVLDSALLAWENLRTPEQLYTDLFKCPRATDIHAVLLSMALELFGVSNRMIYDHLGGNRTG